jgi:hypothetical protein
MANVLQQRLGNQHLAGNPLPTAAAVVAHFGAIQAQDYANAKWALGLRMQEATDAIMDDAFNMGEILRLRVMRPTWHFVTPPDVRWLVELTPPRVNVANAYMYRKLGLDDALFRRSNKTITKALAGGHYLTRPELAAVLAGRESRRRGCGWVTSCTGRNWTWSCAAVRGGTSSSPTPFWTNTIRRREVCPTTWPWPNWPGATSALMARRRWPISPGGRA